MKNRINLWIVMFLAISLALPIYTMAQTTKLTLESPSGDRIGGANVKAFSLGPDNNLVVYLDGPFTSAALLPDILLGSCSSCTITSPATVTASPSSTLSFVVSSSDHAAEISLVVDPLQSSPRTLTSTNGSATFDWNTTNFQPGSYLAVFQATSGANTSQLVVMINIGYTVTASCGSANGTVSPASQTVNYDATATFTVTPNAGYSASVSEGSISGNTWTIPNVTSTHTATVTFNPTSCTVTASVVTPAGGTVSPASQIVNYNSTATFTVTTNSGYTASFSEGTLSGNTWTIPNVTSSHTVTVTFTINTYTVTASIVTPAGGSVSPAFQTVNHGSTTTFTVTPTTGYGASVSEGSLSGTTWTTASVTSTHTATVTFSNSPCTVTASVVTPAGGTVSPASQIVNYNGTATFTVTTNSGYTASFSEGTLSGNTWTIPNVTSSHTVTVTFTINTYTVTASIVTPAGGTVSPASRTVNHGSTTTFTVTPNSGYTASFSEGSISGTTWTTASVTSTHTATVTFTQSVGGGGALGSKTNPIKLSKPMVLVDKGYMSQTSLDSTMGAVNLPGNTKLYFEVDPLGTTGISARSFGLNTKFYNQAFSVCKSLYNKGTQTFSTEACGFPSTYRDIVYDNIPDDLDNYKYLYGIDNNGTASFNIDVWVTINP